MHSRVPGGKKHHIGNAQFAPEDSGSAKRLADLLLGEQHDVPAACKTISMQLVCNKDIEAESVQ